MLKKIISVLLVLVTLAGMTACDDGNYAMKYNDTSISENEYLYWLSTYKAMYLTYYFGGMDTDEIWNAEITNGVTAEKFLEAIARENIRKNIVCIDLFDSLDLKLDKNTIDKVDTYMNTLVEKAGGKSALNSELSAYGINDSDLKEICLSNLKVQAVQKALFAEGGELMLSDSDRDEYYRENYVRVKHIYINNVKDYARDDEGDLVISSETGTYKTRDLTEEEKAAKNALGDSIYADILAGGDFDTLMQENTADTYMNVFKDGYYVTSGSTLLPTELIEKAFEMTDGEVARIDSEIGIHIIKRESLVDGAYNDPVNAAFFSELEATLQNIKITEYLSEKTTDVEEKNEVTAEFSLRTCSPNYNYIFADFNGEEE